MKYVSEPDPWVKEAVHLWTIEAEKTVGAPLKVLIKQSDDPIFKRSEWDAWAGKNVKSETKKMWTWEPMKWSSKALWKTKQSEGCVVLLPSSQEGGVYVPTKEWALWHELGHCLWSANTLGFDWFDMPLTAYGGEHALASYKAESYAEAWALWLHHKHQSPSKTTFVAWRKERDDDAVRCDCVGHWTVPVMLVAWVGFLGVNSVEEVAAWVRASKIGPSDEQDVLNVLKGGVASKKFENPWLNTLFGVVAK